MRKAFTIAVSVAGLVVAGFALSAPADSQTEGDKGRFTFEIIKDVHGDGPSSGFVIAYECVNDEGGPLVSDTLNFDNLVNGDETQTVNVDIAFDDYGTCTITEVDSNGADLVEYECEVFPPQGSAPEGDPPSCTDGQTATHLHSGSFGSFLVRNTFDPEVIPDDVEPPDVAPDVVDATPPFTG